VEQFEIEPLVSELESRVDRLRSLYDQYFMGIERLEPLVPRKDVERRLAMLRKEQIRNTGVRFRFQMIIQRFNTYVTYWQRISRQIETGTFKRHVARATARFGVDPTKEQQSAEATRPDAEANRAQAEKGADSESVPSSAPLVVIPDGEIEEIYDLVAAPDEGGGMDAEDDPFGTMEPEPAARVPRERFASAVKFELDDLADPFEEADPFPKPAQKAQSVPQVRVAQRAPGPEGGSRDTERRIPVAPQSRPTISKRPAAGEAPRSDPQMAQAAARPAAAAPPRVTAQVGPNAPRVDTAPRRPGTLPSAGVPAIRLTPAAPTTAPNVQVAPAAQAGGPPRPLPPLTRAAPSAAANAAPPVSNVAPSVARPAPASAAKPAPSIARPAPASAAKPAPASAPVASIRPAPSVARPAPASTSAVSAKPASRVGDLTGDRFGEIYSKYVETRRQHNEPTHAITRDALAKQLSESTDRLKQKHGSKAIDFEVVVKDGRTILRPVVK
jgi:hypothetical protein